jgi:hypothetical protein
MGRVGKGEAEGEVEVEATAGVGEMLENLERVGETEAAAACGCVVVFQLHGLLDRELWRGPQVA